MPLSCPDQGKRDDENNLGEYLAFGDGGKIRACEPGRKVESKEG